MDEKMPSCNRYTIVWLLGHVLIDERNCLLSILNEFQNSHASEMRCELRGNVMY